MQQISFSFKIPLVMDEPFRQAQHDNVSNSKQGKLLQCLLLRYYFFNTAQFAHNGAQKCVEK